MRKKGYRIYVIEYGLWDIGYRIWVMGAKIMVFAGTPRLVIPAKAGIQEDLCRNRDYTYKATAVTQCDPRTFPCFVVSTRHLSWIPAFAGMTKTRVAGMTNMGWPYDEKVFMQGYTFPITHDLLPITRF